MTTIKAIEGRSVHQIQSGQVIVDLNSVVKELVENSLDAGATSIEIRFKDHGLEAIEVQDNGKGIAPDDYETVALKHHTSKLSTYDDLTTLDTFGFRGEALSSLCALSKFHILTARAEDGALGKKLEFDVSGKLKDQAPAAAQRGTTVFVENIFNNLPVRRKELEKNIKREYGKVISLLYAYACISVGVRYSVTNQMSKAKKTTVFSTKTNTTTKENITNVFGTKTLLALCKLDLHLEMAPASGTSTQGARNWSTQGNNRSLEVHVQGHISKPAFGEGRQAPDRQMFFVNSRPCQLPQVSRAINEVYKSFNVSQSPFIFANLVMDANAYDVNVSPDKRTIMLHDQTALLESLRTALTKMFEETDHTMPQSTLPQRKLPSYQPLTVPRRESTGDTTLSVKKENSGSDESGTEDERASDVTSVQSPANLIQDWIGRDTVARMKPSTRKACKDKIMGEGRPSSAAADADLTRLSDARQPSRRVLSEHEEVATPPASADETNDANTGSALIQTSWNDQDDARSKQIADQANAAPVDPPQRFTVEREPASPVLVRGADDSTPEKHSKSQHFSSSQLTQPFETSTYEGMLTHAPPHAVRNPDLMSTPYDDLFSQRPSDTMPDIQRLEAEQNQGLEEEPIATVTPGTQKLLHGPVQNAFDRMRPLRTPRQVAEITIGDVTTTTVLGSSPPYKKRRIYNPQNSQSVARYGASPSLAHGLRKSFAAPGSQLEHDSTHLTPFSVSERSDLPADQDDEPAEGSLPNDTATRATLRSQPTDVSYDADRSDPTEPLSPDAAVHEDDAVDLDQDEEEKKAIEDARVALLVSKAEQAGAMPTDLKRAAAILKNGGQGKNSVRQLSASLSVALAQIEEQADMFASCRLSHQSEAESAAGVIKDDLDDRDAENRLSLTVSKADFERMTVIGQFNLGFIVAIRPAAESAGHDDLFIIDQHAADEKYNYERLQRTVSLQSQRLVRPKELDLTATEVEIVLNHSDALTANGFEIESVPASNSPDVANEDEGYGGQLKFRLTTLPMSKEKTFDLSDLEELIHLLSEQPTGSTEIPRPKKVQKMLAMRACRSSIMVGRTLTMKQMRQVVQHMGEMDKPWNCPHGRPTMRHLGVLNWQTWKEPEGQYPEDSVSNEKTDWKAYVRKKKSQSGR